MRSGWLPRRGELVGNQVESSMLYTKTELVEQDAIIRFKYRKSPASVLTTEEGGAVIAVGRYGRSPADLGSYNSKPNHGLIGRDGEQ